MVEKKKGIHSIILQEIVQFEIPRRLQSMIDIGRNPNVVIKTILIFWLLVCDQDWYLFISLKHVFVSEQNVTKRKKECKPGLHDTEWIDQGYFGIYSYINIFIKLTLYKTDIIEY